MSNSHVGKPSAFRFEEHHGFEHLAGIGYQDIEIEPIVQSAHIPMKLLITALFCSIALSSCVVKRTTHDSRKGTQKQEYVLKRPIKEAFSNSQ